MTPMKKLPALLLALAVLAAVGSPRPAQAADQTAASTEAANVYVLDQPFSGDAASLQAKTPATDRLPADAAGFPVLMCPSAVVSAAAEPGTWVFWTRRQDKLVRQGEILLGARRDQQQRPVRLSASGVLEIRQAAGGSVVIRSPLRYALVPSLVGTDLLYDPVGFSAEKPVYVPSLNMLVGLQPGGDGMLTAAWPAGKQLAQLHVAPAKDEPAFASFRLDTAGQSVFVRFIDHPGIWHSELLRDDYLEKDTAIAWQRPFDARWIGRFFIDSDGYDFPFYFLAERQKLWGRYIRGWFYYPVWFEGEKTLVHFEKKFPPVGNLLIYYLDTYEGSPEPSPIGVLHESLGKETAAKLLDFKGTEEQVLLVHRNAVCAMTYKIEAHFAQEPQAPPWTEVRQYADDIATFIRLIRERVFQFDRFAADTQAMLEAEKEKQPALAESLAPCEEILAEIRDIAASDLPDVPLEEVGKWTGAIQQLSPDPEKKSLATVKALTQQCRSVAGTQDDMARNLCVVTIRLMEEAARMGTASPEHVRVAQQVIAHSRAVLRQPTWWEPCRRYLPKSNPGAP
ncbi:MAG: hypothetical protein ACYC6Y_16005 [Thermoguttaceae bacterium]